MKHPAPERLSQALAKLLIRIYEHQQEVMQSPLKMGLCTVNPKHARVPFPTDAIKLEFEKCGRHHFELLDIIGFYLRYWTPPMLPVMDCSITNSIDDYQFSFEIPEYDSAWEQITLARNLVFCPGDSEFPRVEEWFTPQIEAIRLTPVLHQNLKELQIIKQIRMKLSLNPLQCFETFLTRYVEVDRNLGLLATERREYAQRKKDWRTLYPEVISIFDKTNTILHAAYTESRKKAAQTRNEKIKDLLWSFAAFVEKDLITSSALTDTTKMGLIDQLQGITQRNPQKYKARRPAISMSDLECGQILYLLFQELGKAPRKKALLGEIILFIWLCQSAAFSDQEFTVDEIRNLCVTDVDFNNKVVKIGDKKIRINAGFAEILTAWIGYEDRSNKRKLLPRLTYDNLEKQIGKFSTSFWGKEGKLLTRDFLAKVHTVPNVRIDMGLRKQIDEQMEILKNSPYKVDTQEIRKHILEAFNPK